MQIAICDDDRSAAEQLAILIPECSKFSNVRADIYEDFPSLIEGIHKGIKYAVVFMDIEWKIEKTGIDFASELFTEDNEIQVVFVTNFSEYSQDIFLSKLNLGGFLIKPVDLKKLNELSVILDKKRILRKGQVLCVTSGRKDLKIFTGRILYIESNLHQCLIHTNKEIIKCNEKLNEILKRLPENFKVCHKSYLVNLERVYKLDGRTVYLDNGESLSVSRALHKCFAEEYFSYLGDKYE